MRSACPNFLVEPWSGLPMGMGRDEWKTEEKHPEGRASNHGDSVNCIREAIKRAGVKWKLSWMLRRGSGSQGSQPALGRQHKQEAEPHECRRPCSRARPPWTGLQAPHRSGGAIMKVTESIWATRKSFLLCCAFPVTSPCWHTVFPWSFSNSRLFSPTVSDVRLRTVFSGTCLLPAASLEFALTACYYPSSSPSSVLSLAVIMLWLGDYLGSLDSSGGGS